MPPFSRICRTGNTMDAIEPPDSVRCQECGGDGEVEGIMFDNEVVMEKCGRCHGTGKEAK